MENTITSLSDGQLIQAYLKAKEAKQAIERKMKERMAPYNEAMYKIENELLSRMLENEAQNISGKDGGTAYISTTYSASIRDRSAFLDFLISNSAFELLDLKANAPSVREYIEETGEPPAGVELKQRTKVNIRRSAK